MGGTSAFSMNEDGSESGASGNYYSNLVIVNAVSIHFESQFCSVLHAFWGLQWSYMKFYRDRCSSDCSSEVYY